MTYGAIVDKASKSISFEQFWAEREQTFLGALNALIQENGVGVSTVMQYIKTTIKHAYAQGGLEGVQEVAAVIEKHCEGE